MGNQAQSQSHDIDSNPQLSEARRQARAAGVEFKARLARLAALLVVPAVASLPAFAAEINVPTPRAPTIQEGIVAANTGDVIIVAPGTYFEAIDFLGKAIELRSSGGAAATIIDGTGQTTSVVKCINGEGPDTILDGFTITNGHAGTVYCDSTCVGCLNPRVLGYGMFNLGSSPTITHCVFSNNGQAGALPVGGAWGGGMANFQGASPIVTNCQFINNGFDTMELDGHGGGIYSATVGTSDTPECYFQTKPVISNCVFINNTARNGGGFAGETLENAVITDCSFQDNAAYEGGGLHFAVIMDIGTKFSTIAGCTFSNNTASPNAGGYGGGAYIHAFGLMSVEMSDCTFTGNQAKNGGGLAIIGTASFGLASPTIRDCTFTGNSSSEGGGIYNSNSNAVIRNCVFDGNDATSFGANAGVGGGMASQGGGCKVANCLFVNNESLLGGGVWLISTAAGQTDPFLLSNCVLLGNTAQGVGGGGGGGVHAGFDMVRVRISNCIVRDNTGAANLVYQPVLNPGWMEVEFSNVQGPLPILAYAHHNVDADPMFVDSAKGDYHLLPQSPCVDAGSEQWALAEGIDTDFEGNLRFTDGDKDDIAWTDMGIYEVPGSVQTPGKFNPPLASWNFNTMQLPNSVLAADVGDGVIDTSGWGGVVEVGNPAPLKMNSLKYNTPDGIGLRLRNDLGGNGTFIDCSFSMAGYENLEISFAGRRSHSNSFNSGVWSYSTDGVNFTELPGVNTSSTSLVNQWARQAVNFNAIESLNDAESVTLRYTLNGAATSTRSFELDNIHVWADPIELAIPGDINGDGSVDVDDLLAIINHWGDCPAKGECIGDIAPNGGNGIVDVDDLLMVINNWG